MTTMVNGKPVLICRDEQFESAQRKGFCGTPERWEEIKQEYAAQMQFKYGEGYQIDFTNILAGADDMFHPD